MPDLAKQPPFENKTYHSHYTTGAMKGSSGDFWEVWDGCNGFSYTRTCGWEFEGIGETVGHWIFGKRGNIKDFSLEKINEKVDQLNNGGVTNRRYKHLLPIPHAKGWDKNKLIFS